jgi:ferredoxin
MVTTNCLQVTGKVDQPNAMLSDDVREDGYALLCVATPLSDCAIREIEESEILDKALAT